MSRFRHEASDFRRIQPAWELRFSAAGVEAGGTTKRQGGRHI